MYLQKLTCHLSPLFSSRIPAGGAPEEVVQRADGQLQPAGASSAERLGRHPGGARPHAAADHRCGEKEMLLPWFTFM